MEKNCYSCGRTYPQEGLKELVPPGGVWVCPTCEAEMIKAGQVRASMTVKVECVNPDGTIAWTDHAVL